MKKILIIEDDESIANLEQDYLEINNFETTVVSRGDTGFEIFKKGVFDLVILDLMLPAKNGYEIVKDIRKMSNVPILMVTAKADSADKVLGLGLGADDYIAKPFDPTELVARVKAHLSRYERLTHEHTIQEDVIHIGDLKIFKQSWRVFIREVEIKLANKEFELLLFLATNPNIVFSKEQLFEKIWGYDYVGDSATVTVHINRIRDKIEHDSNNPKYIETIWGAGYRFNM